MAAPGTTTKLAAPEGYCRNHVGPSYSLGGCSRKGWYKVSGRPGTYCAQHAPGQAERAVQDASRRAADKTKWANARLKRATKSNPHGVLYAPGALGSHEQHDVKWVRTHAQAIANPRLRNSGAPPWKSEAEYRESMKRLKADQIARAQWPAGKLAAQYDGSPDERGELSIGWGGVGTAGQRIRFGTARWRVDTLPEHLQREAGMQDGLQTVAAYILKHRIEPMRSGNPSKRKVPKRTANPAKAVYEIVYKDYRGQDVRPGKWIGENTYWTKAAGTKALRALKREMTDSQGYMDEAGKTAKLVQRVATKQERIWKVRQAAKKGAFEVWSKHNLSDAQVDARFTTQKRADAFLRAAQRDDPSGRYWVEGPRSLNKLARKLDEHYRGL